MIKIPELNIFKVKYTPTGETTNHNGKVYEKYSSNLEENSNYYWLCNEDYSLLDKSFKKQYWTANAYKAEVFILDLEKFSKEDIVSMIENTRHISPQVMNIECKEVNWHDDHPLNKWATQKEALKELFD